MGPWQATAHWTSLRHCCVSPPFSRCSARALVRLGPVAVPTLIRTCRGLTRHTNSATSRVCLQLLTRGAAVQQASYSSGPPYSRLPVQLARPAPVAGCPASSGLHPTYTTGGRSTGSSLWADSSIGSSRSSSQTRPSAAVLGPGFAKWYNTQPQTPTQQHHHQQQQQQQWPREAALGPAAAAMDNHGHQQPQPSPQLAPGDQQPQLGDTSATRLTFSPKHDSSGTTTTTTTTSSSRSRDEFLIKVGGRRCGMAHSSTPIGGRLVMQWCTLGWL
jgi:hypothetical protein